MPLILTAINRPIGRETKQEEAQQKNGDQENPFADTGDVNAQSTKPVQDESNSTDFVAGDSSDSTPALQADPLVDPQANAFSEPLKDVTETPVGQEQGSNDFQSPNKATGDQSLSESGAIVEKQGDEGQADAGQASEVQSTAVASQPTVSADSGFDWLSPMNLLFLLVPLCLLLLWRMMRGKPESKSNSESYNARGKFEKARRFHDARTEKADRLVGDPKKLNFNSGLDELVDRKPVTSFSDEDAAIDLVSTHNSPTQKAEGTVTNSTNDEGFADDFQEEAKNEVDSEIVNEESVGSEIPAKPLNDNDFEAIFDDLEDQQDDDEVVNAGDESSSLDEANPKEPFAPAAPVAPNASTESDDDFEAMLEDEDEFAPAPPSKDIDAESITSKLTDSTPQGANLASGIAEAIQPAGSGPKNENQEFEALFANKPGPEPVADQFAAVDHEVEALSESEVVENSSVDDVASAMEIEGIHANSDEEQAEKVVANEVSDDDFDFGDDDDDELLFGESKEHNFDVDSKKEGVAAAFKKPNGPIDGGNDQGIPALDIDSSITEQISDSEASVPISVAAAAKTAAVAAVAAKPGLVSRISSWFKKKPKIEDAVPAISALSAKAADVAEEVAEEVAGFANEAADVAEEQFAIDQISGAEIGKDEVAVSIDGDAASNAFDDDDMLSDDDLDFDDIVENATPDVGTTAREMDFAEPDELARPSAQTDPQDTIDPMEETTDYSVSGHSPERTELADQVEATVTADQSFTVGNELDTLDPDLSDPALSDSFAAEGENESAGFEDTFEFENTLSDESEPVVESVANDDSASVGNSFEDSDDESLEFSDNQFMADGGDAADSPALVNDESPSSESSDQDELDLGPEWSDAVAEGADLSIGSGTFRQPEEEFDSIRNDALAANSALPAQENDNSALAAELAAIRLEKSELTASLAATQAELSNSKEQESQLEVVRKENAEAKSRLVELEQAAAGQVDEFSSKVDELSLLVENKAQENADLQSQLVDVQKALKEKSSEPSMGPTAASVATGAVVGATGALVGSMGQAGEKAQDVLSKRTKRKFTKLFRAYEKEKKLRSESKQHLVQAEEQRDQVSATLRQLKSELLEVKSSVPAQGELDAQVSQKVSEEVELKVAEQVAVVRMQTSEQAEAKVTEQLKIVEAEKSDLESKLAAMQENLASLEEVASDAAESKQSLESELSELKAKFESQAGSLDEMIALVETQKCSLADLSQPTDAAVDQEQFESLVKQLESERASAESLKLEFENLTESKKIREESLHKELMELKSQQESIESNSRQQDLFAEQSGGEEQLREEIRLQEKAILKLENERQDAFEQLDEATKAQKIAESKVTAMESGIKQKSFIPASGIIAAPEKTSNSKTSKNTTDSNTPSKSKSGADDLTRISGIGPVINKRLKKIGVTTFAQIAAWTKAEAEEFDEKLAFKDRIARENWIKQAKAFVKEDG